MNKLILTLLVAGVAFAGGIAHAQQGGEFASRNIAQAEQITAVDLGIQDAGILPTSPFYFVKEWRRGIQSFFTFDSVKKTELEVKFANEKAAEAQEVADKEPRNAEAIRKAFANYEGSQQRLQERLEALRETSENPNIDRLLDSVAERSVQHEKLFQQLEERFAADEAVVQDAERVRDRIRNAVERVAEKDTPERLQQRLKNALDAGRGSEFKDVRSAEIVERFAEDLPEETRERLKELREEFSERIRERIEEAAERGVTPEELNEAFDRIPGDKEERVTILRELRLRTSERAAGHFEGLATHFEEKLAQRSGIRERAAERIRHAEAELSKLREEMAEHEEVPQAVTTLSEESRSRLEAARTAFENEEYGHAFGAAASAQALARNARHILEFRGTVETLEQGLREDATDLIREAGERNKATEERILRRLNEERQDFQGRVDELRQKTEERKDEFLERTDLRDNLGDRAVCTQEYDPVCGADGRTYSNRCVAERQNGVRVAHEGECRQDEETEERDSSLQEEPERLSPSSLNDSSSADQARAVRSIEADDNGFYPSSEVRVPKGAAVTLTFNVRPLGVYFGGLDFRSDKFDSATAKPGEAVTVTFVADESFDFTSWWPASEVLKARGRVVVE